MIATDPPEKISPPTGLALLLAKALAASALIFAALQCWRPLFFLTDDNLDFSLPFFTEVGRHLLAGQSPFSSDHLFGGDYNLLRDPSYFSWHPLYLLTSLLAGTPFRFFIIDIDAFVFFLLATAGFVVMASHLRREMGLTIRDGWIIFYALSFTYSMIALTLGASWLSYMGNQSALPWLALGILHRDARRGVTLVLLFSLHQVLAGQFSPTVTSTIFLSVFAGAVAFSRRSFQPLVNWLGGSSLALVVLLPLLVPVAEGFFASARSHGVTLQDLQANNIPFTDFPTSLFIGTALWWFNPPANLGVTYTLALGAAAAVWCVLPALLSRAKWRGLEVVGLGMALFSMVMICRPVWISEVMLHLPLLRSIRWPFRELLEFQFFLHLFLVLRPPGMTPPARPIIAAWGTAVLLIPMVFYPQPPTLSNMTADRNLILHGGFERYWAQVRPLLQPSDRVAVVIPYEFFSDHSSAIPFSLLGTYNYACLAGFVNLAGYSPTPPMTKNAPLYTFGAYLPAQKPAIADQPGLRFITLESLHPLKITLSSKAGPTIDLTPFVPPEAQVP